MWPRVSCSGDGDSRLSFMSSKVSSDIIDRFNLLLKITPHCRIAPAVCACVGL